MNEYLYIYNLKQALYFIEQGLIPVNIAYSQEGKVYHKFIKTEKCQVIFDKWKENGRKFKGA